MNYTTLQIRVETRNNLKEYCKKNGYSMSRLVEKLINDKIHTHKLPTVDPSKVMKVHEGT
jgi:hypothetical protein